MASRTRSHCADCGSAQASHLSLWIDNAMDAVSLRVPMHRVPLYRVLIRITDLILSLLGQLSFFGARALRIAALTDDIATAVSDRSRLLWLEAKRRGIPMQQLILFGSATDLFLVRHMQKAQFFRSLPLSPEPVALRMDDKVLFKEKMRAADLPVPESFGVRSLREAQQALAAVSVACVKPRTGSNGRHTYPHVRTEDELRGAFRSVKRIAPFVSVEEYLEGDLCRATCVGGRMIGFLQSAYPSVTGDGSSTIAELIARANAQKPEGVDDMELDAVNLGFIERRGYTPDSVLPEGIRLNLSYRGGTGSGGSNREYGRDIHPSFIEPIERAARLTGLDIVGFDLIIPDPQLPADSQRWGFIEANSLPWVDLHAHPYYGEPIDLSPAIWDLWLTAPADRSYR